jgi:hypothetical protein
MALIPTCGADHFTRSAWDCNLVRLGQRQAPAAYDPVSVTRGVGQDSCNISGLRVGEKPSLNNGS